MPALRVTRSIQIPMSLSAATASCWAATQNCKSSNGRAGDSVASRIAIAAPSNLMVVARRQKRHLFFRQALGRPAQGAGPLLARNRPASGSRPILSGSRDRPLGVGGQRSRNVEKDPLEKSRLLNFVRTARGAAESFAPPSANRLIYLQKRPPLRRSPIQFTDKIRLGIRVGWGTRIRTLTSGVRVRCSTVKLSPNSFPDYVRC